MAYKNQFKVELKGRLTFVGPDDYIQIGDDEKLKIVASLECTDGNEEEGDEVEFCMWGEKAEKLAACQVGDEIHLKGNVKSRFIDRRDGQGHFTATEITCWYLDVKKEEKNGRNYKKDAEENRGAGGRDGRADAGKRQSATERTRSDERETPKRDAAPGARIGSGRSPNRR